MNGNSLANFELKPKWLVTQKRSGCSLTALPISCSSDSGSVSSTQLNGTVVNYLTNNGQRVARISDLITLANKIIGGTLIPGSIGPDLIPVPSLSSVFGMVGGFNELFDECRAFVGYFDCKKTCANLNSNCTSVVIPFAEKVTPANSSNNLTPTVGVFPNPYHDNVTFVIGSPIDAKGSLKIYNAMGQLISNVFQGSVSAGKSKSILFTAPVADGSLFYIYEQNGQKVTGKLIKQ